MKLLTKRAALTALCASCLLLLGTPAHAADYKMTSLDWPPYTNEKLPAKGASSAVVSEVIKAAGGNVKIEFYAWTRTLNLVKTDPGYIAYFPEYYSKANEADFLYSDPIGTGPLVFIERKADPVKWSTYDSLKGKKIGVVKDYVNTDELDAKIASKALTGEEAPDDVKNLLKLAAGRVDLAVVDINVYNYLVKNEPLLKEAATKLQANAKILEDKKLYVCFKKSPEGEKALKAFNQALKKVDVDAIMKKYMN
ncbi:MAG: transporter substrate-binding domain-containing protein [Rhodoferax sp.]|nr:transporter substrate-binding domain-containing protein [Rhodoferax sp.]MDP3653096.1 transporter substrate-binding domain-containing protein [Rhodoferax sp.]